MKKAILVLAMAMASQAHADGFKCSTESGLNIKVYNHTSASEGTRVAAVMVISDESIGGGNKTIAKFTDVKGTLTSKSSRYVADVDLRFSDSARKGELIAGTKLGYIDTITLDVDFSFSPNAEKVYSGDEVSAELTILKRNGEEIAEEATCVRYLKN